jgi:hypothetical protein
VTVDNETYRRGADDEVSGRKWNDQSKTTIKVNIFGRVTRHQSGR